MCTGDGLDGDTRVRLKHVGKKILSSTAIADVLAKDVAAEVMETPHVLGYIMTMPLIRDLRAVVGPRNTQQSNPPIAKSSGKEAKDEQPIEMPSGINLPHAPAVINAAGVRPDTPKANDSPLTTLNESIPGTVQSSESATATGATDEIVSAKAPAAEHNEAPTDKEASTNDELSTKITIIMTGMASGDKVEVPVIADSPEISGEVLQMVVKCRPFQDWVQKVEADPILFIKEIVVQSVDMFGPRVGFVKFRSSAVIDVGGSDGFIPVPGVVFMRGGAIGVLLILECDGEEFTVLTRQARVPIGSHDFPEIPAGMLDGNGNFKGVAAQEIAEECDIQLHESELIDMTQMVWARFDGMYPSAGGCDEFIRLFVVRRVVDIQYMAALEGRLTGLFEEGERITLELVRLSEVWQRTPDCKALSALALYERLVKAGKIKRGSSAGPSGDWSPQLEPKAPRPSTLRRVGRIGSKRPPNADHGYMEKYNTLKRIQTQQRAEIEALKAEVAELQTRVDQDRGGSLT